MTEPITDLEMDWATVSTQQIVATLRALVPLCSPDRNMELIAEAANRLEADHQAADTITALRAEVEALRGASPTMLTAFLTTVSSNGKYIWYEFARAHTSQDIAPAKICEHQTHPGPCSVCGDMS